MKRNKILASLLLAFTLPSAAASLVDGCGDCFTFGTKTNPAGVTFEVDSHGFIIGGKHVLPVMGEMHYARVPRKDWQREIRKMKAGGITVLATYCFWIHHEAEEGRWDWSGNRDLHAFLEVCKQENMPVVLRVGPFCHGEVYQGGFPVWLTDKAKANPQEYKLRSQAKGFIAATQRLYSNIFAQASDMLWKDGGPVVGVQIENECRGPWPYYMQLKDMAISIGFDVPFMTRTGWPKLNGKEEFGKLLPLYGDYADGFWDRTHNDMPKEYQNAFIMKDSRISSAIATETFGTNQDTKMEKKDMQYPYLTCELGGGMMPAYHRRINMSGNEAMPLAICKLGSGSNLPGYYMYHGGTNPYCADHTMAETQTTAVTNYNDMPYMTYDFQCQLGEMGQPNYNAFHQTRLLHQFLADWGEELSVMGVDTLSDHYTRRGCFEFYNDYVRILNEGGASYVRPVDMPFRGHTITADAQPFCHVGDTLYFIPVKGKKPVVAVDGKKCTPLKPKTISGITVQVLSDADARRAYKIDGRLLFAANDHTILYKAGEDVVAEEWQTQDVPYTVTTTQTKEADAPRKVGMGTQKVAAMPVEADFAKAAVWSVAAPLTEDTPVDDMFLCIEYSGDCARLYADGVLVEDNFWNGKPMLVRYSDLVKEENGQRKLKDVELRILPMGKDAPVYLQKEQKAELEKADAAKGLLNLKQVSFWHRVTNKAPSSQQ